MSNRLLQTGIHHLKKPVVFPDAYPSAAQNPPWPMRQLWKGILRSELLAWWFR